MVSEARRLLPVKAGERGLRQSDALFFHVQQISDVMSTLLRRLRTTEVTWSAVGVSVRPRPEASSYMPVFLAGTRFAESFAALAAIPIVRTSHQEGHLAAAEHSIALFQSEPFLAVHLSGGTSDVLFARRTRFGYAIEQLGSSSDLNAGQFVDRVGVALGLGFPAGPQLERLADFAGEPELEGEGGGTIGLSQPLRFASSVSGSDMSFSGPCSAALRAVERGASEREVARAVFASIATSLVKAITAAKRTKPEAKVCLLAGGVMANKWIRQRITHRLSIVEPSLKLHFAEPTFASDNALGVATIARQYVCGQ